MYIFIRNSIPINSIDLLNDVTEVATNVLSHPTGERWSYHTGNGGKGVCNSYQNPGISVYMKLG